MDMPYQKIWIGSFLSGQIDYRDTFCSNCWRHERFFTGGQSWSPDLCSCGCEDTKPWYKMTLFEKHKAKKKYKEDLKKWQR
jgi:hypothetical protein